MRRPLVIALALAVLAFTACGDDGNDGNDGNGTTATTTTTTASSTTTLQSHEVKVFWLTAEGDDCSAVDASTRTVQGSAVLAEAMRALLAGPTAAERGDGFESLFSERTAGMLRSARVDEGVARIDFADFSRIIPNASSSCGSQGLLAQLDATSTQFPTVKRAVYSFEGDVAAFYEWLQLSPPDS